MSNALDRLAPERKVVVRAQVRDLLVRSDAFQQLPADERKRLASSLVNVVAALSDPDIVAGSDPIAEPMAGQIRQTEGAKKTADRLSKKGELVQADFKAAAVRDGAAAFKDLVNAVDFPKFVAGLIHGVFDSIVDASIRQMQAYGKLLEGVVKSLEQFANDHVSPNQARDFLASRHPGQMQVQFDNGQPRLTGGDDDEANAALAKQYGLKSLDLSDESNEAELVRKAQMEMARMRQQQLATMVMLGINRIVVTDGLINAKVVFDVQASDRAKRKNSASMYDEDNSTNQSRDGGGWFSSSFDASQDAHKTVVKTSSDDTSESKVEAKAKLTGEVRVAFKSEAVPLDKIASQQQISTVQERSQR